MLTIGIKVNTWKRRTLYVEVEINFTEQFSIESLINKYRVKSFCYASYHNIAMIITRVKLNQTLLLTKKVDQNHDSSNDFKFKFSYGYQSRNVLYP